MRRRVALPPAMDTAPWLAEIACNGGNPIGAGTGNIWWPDLRTNQTVSTIAIMVRF